LIKLVIPKNLNLKIKEFIDLCQYKRPSSPKGGIIELGVFGTFQFDEDVPGHYNANDVGLKCLINIPGWGDIGQAQLFYQPCNDGELKYKFRNRWEGPGYDTTKDRDLYMGRRQAAKSDLSLADVNADTLSRVLKNEASLVPTETSLSRAPATRSVDAAFMATLTPSSALAQIVGANPLPRTEVVSLLWAYIKKNDLLDKVDRQMINADDRLAAVFGKLQVTMFEMAKLIKGHLK